MDSFLDQVGARVRHYNRDVPPMPAGLFLGKPDKEIMKVFIAYYGLDAVEKAITDVKKKQAWVQEPSFYKDRQAQEGGALLVE